MLHIKNPLTFQLFVTLVLLLPSCILFFLYILPPLQKIDLSRKFINFIILWFLTPALFYTIYFLTAFPVVYQRYLVEFLPSFCLMGGCIVYATLAKFRSKVKLRVNTTHKNSVLVVLLFLYSLSLALNYPVKVTSNMPQSIDTTNKVAKFLQNSTLPNEPIFTSWVIYAVESERPLFLHLSHPSMYRLKMRDEEYKLLHLPSPSQLIEEFKRDPPLYVIVDSYPNSYTERNYYSTIPGLRDYIANNYALVKKLPGMYGPEIRKLRKDV